jgi:ankyrin repeat protein
MSGCLRPCLMEARGSTAVAASSPQRSTWPRNKVTWHSVEATPGSRIRGADVNAGGGLYGTALQAAAAGGFDDLVEYLLDRGADARKGGGLFSNALSAAVFSGTFNIVPMLFEKGAGINVQDEQGRIALHLSAWRGNLENMEWLLGKGGDMEIRDFQGRTMMHHAAMGGSLDMIKHVAVSLNTKDVYGWMPLHWTCRSKSNEEVVQFLIQIASCPKDISASGKNGWTPEILAICHEADDLLPLLATAVTEPTQLEKSNKGETEYTNKRWKVCSSRRSHMCDGCHQQIVSPHP